MDNSTGNQNQKTKTFLIGKDLSTNDLQHTAAERGNRTDNPKPRIVSAKGRVKPPARLLRCATALRVTAPLGYGSRRLERDGSDPPEGGRSRLYLSLREGSLGRTTGSDERRDA